MFTRTSLGTRIVIAVSPETTVGDFKREFERAHLNCFQELGRIRVYGLKVKKKSCFYNLPESFPLKHISENLKNHLLHIEVYHLKNQSGPTKSQGVEICNHLFDPKDVPKSNEVQKFVATRKNNRISNRRGKRNLCFRSLLWEFPRSVHFLKRKKKCSKRRRKRNTAAENTVHRFQRGPNISGVTISQFTSSADGNCGKVVDDSPQKVCSSEIISESISVSSIIKRYFTNYDEVTSSSRFSDSALPTVNKEYSREIASNYHNREFDMSLPLAVGTPPQILQPHSLDQHWTKSSRSMNGKNIGRRLIAAAENIGVHLSKKSPILSLCKYRNRNPSVPNSSAPMKDLIFGISDEGD